MVHSPAPSISAASNSSCGSESKKPFNRKIENPFAAAGRTIAQNVFNRCRSLSSRNDGIIVTSAGNAIVAMQNSRIAYVLGGLKRLSAYAAKGFTMSCVRTNSAQKIIVLRTPLP